VKKFFWVLFVTLVCGFQLAAKEIEKAELDSLINRVESRWKTIAAHSFGDTYEYETPTYKKVFPKSLYVNMFSYSVNWHLTGVTGVSFDSKSGVATVIVDVETKSVHPVGMPADETVIPVKFNEKWLHINDQWWHSSTN